MKTKKLRFMSNLVPLVLSGKKYVTWRMFDDKNLLIGDHLILVDRGTDKEFAQADIVGIYEKKFGDINEKDFVGHEEFKTKKEMIDTYDFYYDGKVKDDTIVKIIKFKMIKISTKNCPFCNLDKNQLIIEDENCMGIVISEPLKDGHLMVLPKRHILDIKDLSPKESQAINNLLSRFRKIIFETYNEDPIIFMNFGSHSSQPHIHFHILPSKGGLRDMFSLYEKVPRKRTSTPEELKKVKDKIKNACEVRKV